MVERRPLSVYESLAVEVHYDSVEQLRTTLATLSLTAIDARLEALLEDRREERTILCRFPARSDEHRSRCTAAALSEGQAATGAPALSEDFRSVRLVYGPGGSGKTWLLRTLKQEARLSGSALQSVTSHLWQKPHAAARGDLCGGYSTFGIGVVRNHALKWLFSQEKATLHSAQKIYMYSESALDVKFQEVVHSI